MNKSPIAYKRLYREAKIEIIKLKQIIDTQESRLQDLERRLAYYNNTNTPPSHNALSRQARRQKKNAGTRE